jgi:MoxR-like ATPase
MSELEYKGEYLNPDDPYLPDKDLVEAVNVAIALERPLLLRGEPGCGKSRLAKAVAYELSRKTSGRSDIDLGQLKPEDWPVPYWEWPVKSTSQARDGLYVYDMVGRLRDAQLAPTNLVDDQQRAKFSEPLTYVSWGKLGQAFRSDRRAVVLIDEIDKADIDFPNDLLQELDQQFFTVLETSPQIEVWAKHRPIILITSNDEKPLSDAFLRRCLFYFLEFPKPDRLREIVSHHLRSHLRRDLTAEQTKLVEDAVECFRKLREKMEEDKRHGGKKVSTSELIDWVKMLERKGVLASALDGDLLFPTVLLKSHEDQLRYVKKQGAG